MMQWVKLEEVLRMLNMPACIGEILKGEFNKNISTSVDS